MLLSEGLGITIKGVVRPSSDSFRQPISFVDIAQCLRKHTSGIFLKFLQETYTAHECFSRLVPGDDRVRISSLGEGEFLLEATTNSTGPGYHAYVVELVEKVGEDLGIDWYWDLEEGGMHYHDRTGYYHHRDFEQLQLVMLQWFHSLAHYLLQQGNKMHMIGMPDEYPRMRFNPFAANPVQLWTREWFEAVAAHQPEYLAHAGESFFIWWHQEADGLFHKHVGLCLLNLDCTWRHPEDLEEKKLLELINTCFTQAALMDPSLPLPEDDWECVRSLNDFEPTDIPESLYGFRKHDLSYDFVDRWCVDIPGRFTYELLDDSNIFRLVDDTICLEFYGISGGSSDEEMAAQFFHDVPQTAVVFHESTTQVAGKAIHYYFHDEQAEADYWILQGIKIKDGALAYITIQFDEAEQLDWALKTWNSLHRVPEPEEVSYREVLVP